MPKTEFNLQKSTLAKDAQSQNFTSTQNVSAREASSKYKFRAAMLALVLLVIGTFEGISQEKEYVSVKISDSGANARSLRSTTCVIGQEFRPADGFLSIIPLACPETEEAFDSIMSAVDLWNKIIVGTKLESYISNSDLDVNSYCGDGLGDNIPQITLPSGTKFDHLRIYMDIQYIDGASPSSTFGFADNCYYDSFENLVPIIGYVVLDKDDLPDIQQYVFNLVLHELGHAIGIGNLMYLKQQGGLQTNTVEISKGRYNVNNPLTADAIYPRNSDTDSVQPNNQPKFIGENAVAAFQELFDEPGATFVPLENGVLSDGEQIFNFNKGEGDGTVDQHLKITKFQDELMTMYVDFTPTRVSAVTLGMLTDLGYTVDPSAIKDYEYIPPALRGRNLRSETLSKPLSLGNHTRGISMAKLIEKRPFLEETL